MKKETDNKGIVPALYRIASLCVAGLSLLLTFSVSHADNEIFPGYPCLEPNVIHSIGQVTGRPFYLMDACRLKLLNTFHLLAKLVVNFNIHADRLKELVGKVGRRGEWIRRNGQVQSRHCLFAIYPEVEVNRLIN